MRALIKQFIFCGLLFILVGGVTGGLWFYSWLNSTLPNLAKTEIYHVKSGSSLMKVSRQLHLDGQLEYPRLLTLYARFTDQSNIKAGEYRWPHDLTPETLLKMLHDGNVLTYDVALIEGWTYDQVLNHLHEQPKITPHLKGLSWEEQRQRIGLGIEHPEGWFFPDTYHYVANASDIDILRRAHQAMEQVLDREWQQRAEGLPYKTPYEALIMASIVERETGAAEERPTIAGVFVRRLELGMRLQTDPTVIYGLGDAFTGNLTRRHLRQKSDYNTYLNHGLPPTPIALAGRAAIYAALNPAAGTALYFVAKGDGSHYFSDTLQEHNKAVQHYQVKKRRSDYSSAPK